MSATNVKAGPASKGTQGGIASIVPSGSAILLDKLNIRRSTPDSEAVASSDDEHESHRPNTSQPPVQKPVRRASWLNDTSPSTLPHPRKGSFAGASMPPTSSHPNTPSAEAGAGWASHNAPSAASTRGHQANSGFSWGSGIWTTERKEPPSRLTEVLPSPTSTVPSGQGFFNGEGVASQTSPTPREQGTSSQIPFAIPLHPTPKTYRSQSYSVGQLDPESLSPVPSSVLTSRARAPGPPGLQHRPSRPSMLSEMSSDGSTLGKVKEVEDGEESTSESPKGTHQQLTSDAKKIEMLTRENALLRQQQKQQSMRIRPRASTAAAYGLGGNGYSVHDPVPEESDYAVDELDEAAEGQDPAVRRALVRRMSEYASLYRYPPDNRKLENVKKAFWQSSLGFTGLSDIPQSRRHSFADVPTRQPSIGSMGEAVSLHESQPPDVPHNQDYTSFQDATGYSTASPVGYYTGGSTLPTAQQVISPSYTNPYQPSYYSNRPPSPHRGMYGMNQPRHNQLLHIVLFKCSRADVFYIQEGTGLTVRPGDLVIVEADRGTDLGTVAEADVDWQRAKECKEHYAEEHYRWLVMYSQNAATAQEGTGAGLMAANSLQGSAIGGMGPPSGHHTQEPSSGELKPKMIKRLAQSHEIHALRDKEGNEAKAKRMCMQKVKEHGLNMEILDAEFQMDWKKLTFYYFADSYINFNSLVTDLFKIYKTRIWMSAINPASFASPTLGLQAPSGVGPGVVGVGRVGSSSNADRRGNQGQETQGAAFANANPTGRSFQPTFSSPFVNTNERQPPVGTSAYPTGGFSYPGYAPYTGTVRSPGYMPGVLPSMDAYGTAFAQGADFPPTMRTRFTTPNEGPSPHEQTQTSLAAQNEWASAFQGLSLNTR
ncbi:hypothetical protein F5Y17DRAFT_343424 [Xylariaceae sp. FL0594]|nr:hypothetical protein F5Y17DRAFT_343424 [Xylariaceae sp. FL0594]